MQDYLFHPLAGGQSSQDDITLAFEGEAEAIRHALSDAFPNGCELWRDFRLLGRFCGPAPGQRAVTPAVTEASLAA